MKRAKPRQLHYVRIQDVSPAKATNPDFEGIPVTYEVVYQWFDFCRRLAENNQLPHGHLVRGKAVRPLPDFELVTIDFNFEDDKTTPKTAGVFKDSRNIARLERISWHPALRDIGPVSGILMGATLTGLNAHRDLPCGVALHTGYSEIVATDFASTMLVTQMLQLCGQPLVATDTASLLEQTIDVIRDGESTVEAALVRAIRRFRDQILRRIRPEGTVVPRLIVRWDSITTLLMILKSIRERRPQITDEQAEEEVDQVLALHGLEVYDTRGQVHCLDIRSIFADKYFPSVNEEPYLSRLPLTLIEPGNNGQPEGELHRFLAEVEHEAFCDTGPLFTYFRRARERHGVPEQSILTALKGYPPIYQLVALLFAWLEEFGCQYRDEHARGYDATSDKRAEPGSHIPSRPYQLAAAVRFIGSLDGVNAVRRQEPPTGFCAMLDDDVQSAQFSEFRYLRRRPNQQRRLALEQLIDSLVAVGAIDRTVDGQGTAYRITGKSPESRFLFQLDQASLACRLGFKGFIASNKQLQRILNGTLGRNTKLADFLARLQDSPLAGSLRALGRDYMDAFWGSRQGASGGTREASSQGGEWLIPKSQWPVCLGGRTRDGHLATFAEERREVTFFVNRSRDTIASIVRPKLARSFRGGHAFCFHDSYHFVGGDFYSFYGDDHFNLLIGDVQGHGYPSAYIVAEISGFLRGLPATASEPAEMLNRINWLLRNPASTASNSSMPERTATIWVGQLEYRQHQACPVVLRYSCGAHPYAWLLRNGRANCLGAGDHTLGMMPEAEHYRVFEESLATGDILFLLTDGVVEDLMEELETELPDATELVVQIAIKESLRTRASSAEEFVMAVWNRLEEIRPRRYWHDDATMMAVIID